MLEFLLELFAELLGEFLLQLFAEAIVDVTSRFLGELLETERARNIAVNVFIYGVIGAVVGWFSFLIFPHPLVRPSRFHGISLLISPLLTGLAMSLIGSLLRRQDKKVVPIESFGCGSAFAFGMALVRFIFVK